MKVYIYGLFCPVAQQIRYIGKSDDPDRRYKAHIGSARKPRCHKTRWLAKLARTGLVPELLVLREVADGDDWAKAERDEIAKARALGWPLTNMTLGGEGAPLNEAGRTAKLKAMSKPETRQKMSESAKARWSDPVLGAIGRAQNSDPKRRAKLSASCKDRATSQYREAQATRSKAAWSDPDKRARIVGGITEETRVRVSAASKAAWEASPNMDRCRANLLPPTAEMQAMAAVARSTPEHKAKMREIWDSPEYREKLSQALRQSWERRRADRTE